MITIQQFRPVLVGAEFDSLPFYKKINFQWLLQRIPMLLFALVSSYGVGHLLSISDVPFPFDYLGAISFDVGFLGAISLADMQLKKTTWSNVAYYALNFIMSGLGALFNVLSHAGGKYANITAEDITVGFPFALVGLAFALYYHSVMSGYIDKEEKLQAAQKEKDDSVKEPCKYCGTGFPKLSAVYGHYRSCQLKTMHDKTPGKDTCKCLQCNPK